jgi:DnaA family protein
VPQQLILEWTREIPPAFDNFLAGSNGEVLAHLRSRVAGDLRSASVLIWGAPGSGKSHLLAAALAAARARKRSAAAAHLEQDQPPAAAPGALYAIDDVDTLSAGGQGRCSRSTTPAAMPAPHCC